MTAKIDGMVRITQNSTTFVLDLGSNALTVAVEKNGFDDSCFDVIVRYAKAHETDTGLLLSYRLGEEEISFREAVRQTSTRLERLLLAQSLATCMRERDGFKVPLMHPDNIYLTGGFLRVVHFGLRDTLAPMVFDETQFLASLQALVLQIFHPKIEFEHIQDGAAAFQDKFSRSVRSVATIEELFTYVNEQVRTEQAKIAATKTNVSKRRYFWYRMLGIFGLAATLTVSVFAWQVDIYNRLQNAVISAQARFLANDYAGTLTELAGHAATELPKSAKYVLAVSSVNLHELTMAQKQSILNTISEKSDDVTLNYWIAMGRGEFEQALDYAKNLGDDQLTLLAYTDLYQTTKLNTKMAGGKKQKLLSEYAQAIHELAAKMNGADDTVTK